MDTALADVTRRRYYAGSAFQGIWTAGQYLFPFILAKSLGAPSWVVTLAVLMETSGMVMGLYWGQFMAGGRRRRVLLWGGLAGRGVTVAALLATTPGAYVAMLAAVYLFISIVYPAQNGILQENIPAAQRGDVFGRGALIQHLVAAACSLAIGPVLDADPAGYRWLLPAIGLLGCGYPVLLASLPRPARPAAAPNGGPAAPPTPRALAAALWQPLAAARDTFRRDRAYLWYQLNFTVYGIAFIMLVPVVPLYFADELALDYGHIAHARVLVGSLGMGLLGPLAGRLMDRLHPARLCALAFGWVALFPLALAFGPALPGVTAAGAAYAAFGIYSVGMAGVNVTWNVGSIAFAPPGQGGHYQGIHVAMVGVRGLLAPVLGFVLLETVGYRAAFVAAAGLFLAAATGSALLARHLRRRAD